MITRKGGGRYATKTVTLSGAGSTVITVTPPAKAGRAVARTLELRGVELSVSFSPSGGTPATFGPTKLGLTTHKHKKH
ncbi:MAG: hypothetical protein ABSC56_01175 [Solirubrobacteraceae bacterium]